MLLMFYVLSLAIVQCFLFSLSFDGWFIILSLFMGMNADDDLVLMTRACMHGMSHLT